jgi:hypothetical protein
MARWVQDWAQLNFKEFAPLRPEGRHNKPSGNVGSVRRRRAILPMLAIDCLVYDGELAIDWFSFCRQDGFETLHLRLYQLDRLIEEHLPELWNHLVQTGIESHMYASQWFLTLFTAKFPLFLVFHILDVFLCQGMETIFQVSRAISSIRKPFATFRPAPVVRIEPLKAYECRIVSSGGSGAVGHGQEGFIGAEL